MTTRGDYYSKKQTIQSTAVAEKSFLFKRKNFFVAGVVLIYFGYIWFWSNLGARYNLGYLALITFRVASFLIVTTSLFVFGRSILDK